MMTAGETSGSLVSWSVARTASASWLRALAVVLAVALTAAAAQVTIPLPFMSVPFVLTPLVVLLAGAALGSRLGALVQILYLIIGASGFAVFAPSATLPPGLLRLAGPTGGFLMAYPAAAFISGWLAERGWDRRYLTSVAAMLAGLALIFAGGVAWLSLSVTHSLGTAWTLGAAPFIAFDIAKVTVAAVILPQVWKVVGRSPR